MSDENLPGKAFSARDLRDALSNFATGVTIVTALDERSQPIGMTCSSFNSVSMDPPLILWSVTKTALSAEAFREAKHFGVHILDAAQSDLSNRFAKSGADKFSGVAHNVTTTGIPQIAGALTRFDCKTWAVYEGGDHWIIVGEVIDMDATNGEGLVFSQGSYATATPMRFNKAKEAGADSTEGPIEELLLYQVSRAYRQMADRFHKAVRNSGLSVPEWRILASLTGGVTRDVPSLSERTFVDHIPLQDTVIRLEEAGLCKVSGAGAKMVVTGTPEGQARVAHLFDLGQQQEAEAFAGAGKTARDDLIKLLRVLVENTNS